MKGGQATHRGSVALADSCRRCRIESFPGYVSTNRLILAKGTAAKSRGAEIEVASSRRIVGRQSGNGGYSKRIKRAINGRQRAKSDGDIWGSSDNDSERAETRPWKSLSGKRECRNLAIVRCSRDRPIAERGVRPHCIEPEALDRVIIPLRL